MYSMEGSEEACSTQFFTLYNLRITPGLHRLDRKFPEPYEMERIQGSWYPAVSHWFWNHQELLVNYSLEAYSVQLLTLYNLHIVFGVNFLGQNFFLVKDCWAYPFSAVSSHKLGARLISTISDGARAWTAFDAVFHGLQPPDNSCPSVTWAKHFRAVLHGGERGFNDTQLSLRYPRLINDFWWSTRSFCIKCSFSRSTTSTSSPAYVSLAKIFSLSRTFEYTRFPQYSHLSWETRLIRNISGEVLTWSVFCAAFQGLQRPYNARPQFLWPKFFPCQGLLRIPVFISIVAQVGTPNDSKVFRWRTPSNRIRCSFSRATTSISCPVCDSLAKKFSLSGIVEDIWFFEWHRLRWHPCCYQMFLVKYSVEACRM